MTATVTTSYKGNTALETQVWTIPVKAALEAAGELGARPGSYWEANLAKPARKAKRAKLDTVRVFTAGFSSGELSNVLFSVGCQVDNLD